MPILMMKILFLFCLAISFLEGGAWATPMGNGNFYSDSAPSTGHHPVGKDDMMLDVSVDYLRSTNSNGATDTAGKVSLGGNFNDWLGMDAQGLYQVRAKNYLIGADLRVMPVEWAFVKGGVGAYSQKIDNSLSLTPLVGAGLMAHIAHGYYIMTETSYFEASDHANVSFGVGMGITF